jgi:hypothetical protein
VKAGAGSTLFDGTPFICGHSTPDAGILVEVNGPLQAGPGDLAPTADDLSHFDLVKRGAGVPNREEQIGVLAQAGNVISPSHQHRAP